MPICLYCGEPVVGGAEYIPHVGFDGATMRAIHAVCRIRSMIGGINHLLGVCTCCGGTEPPDPPELTRHQAAIAAVDFWCRLRNGAYDTPEKPLVKL